MHPVLHFFSLETCDHFNGGALRASFDFQWAIQRDGGLILFKSYVAKNDDE